MGNSADADQMSPVKALHLGLHCQMLGPSGVWGIWGEWLFISGSWRALVIILGELGSKLTILGI